MFLRIAGSKYFAIYFLHFLRIVSIRLRQIFLDLIFDLSFWKIGLFHKFSTLFLHWDNFKYWDYFLYWDYFVYWDYFLDWDYFMYWDYFGRDYFLYWDYFLFWDYLDMGLFWSGLFWAGLLWAGLFWSGLFQHPASNQVPCLSRNLQSWFYNISSMAKVWKIGQSMRFFFLLQGKAAIRYNSWNLDMPFKFPIA